MNQVTHEQRQHLTAHVWFTIAMYSTTPVQWLLRRVSRSACDGVTMWWSYVLQAERRFTRAYIHKMEMDRNERRTTTTAAADEDRREEEEKCGSGRLGTESSQQHGRFVVGDDILVWFIPVFSPADVASVERGNVLATLVDVETEGEEEPRRGGRSKPHDSQHVEEEDISMDDENTAAAVAFKYLRWALTSIRDECLTRVDDHPGRRKKKSASPIGWSPAVQQSGLLVEQLLRRHGDNLRFGDAAVRANRRLVEVAIMTSGSAFRFASEVLRNDMQLAFLAACDGPRRDVTAMECVGEVLRNSFAVFREARRRLMARAGTAVAEWSHCAKYFLRNGTATFCTKENMMTVLSMDGCLLEHCGPVMQRDKDLVLAAVKQDGTALRFADAALKACKEVVLMALKSSGGRALPYVDVSLRKDSDVLRLVAKGNAWSLQAAEPERISVRSIYTSDASRLGKQKTLADKNTQMRRTPSSGLARQPR